MVRLSLILVEIMTVATSGGEQIVEWLPKTRVVKIFNTVGWETKENPQYNSERATMFYTGNDAEAKRSHFSLQQILTLRQLILEACLRQNTSKI